MSTAKDRRRLLRVAYALAIQDFREEAGLSQSQLAAATDIQLRTIQRIEQAERPVHAPELEVIGEALHIQPEEIMIEARRRVAEGEIPSDADRAADVWRSALGD